MRCGTRSIGVVALAVAAAVVSAGPRSAPGYRELIAAYRQRSDSAVRTVLGLSTFDVRTLPLTVSEWAEPSIVSRTARTRVLRSQW
jgi:hypothetical protein